MTIVSAERIDAVEERLSDLGSQDLAVFDCDGVLTTVAVELFKPQNRDFAKKWCKEAKTSKEELYDKLRLVLINETNFVVNQRMVDLVEKLAERGIKRMVATSYSVRPLDQLKNPVQWRIETLKELGYHFEKSWPDLPDNIELDDFLMDYNPVFSEGVLCCDFCPKSECLKHFFNKIQWHPRKIVFIDDDLRKLTDVGTFCEKEGIDYVGIEYLESKYIDSYIPFSENIGQIQMDNLFKKSLWIKDEEAEKMTSK